MDIDRDIDIDGYGTNSNTGGQAVASASHTADSVESVIPDASPCERCFLCSQFVTSPDMLLVCSNRSPDRDGHMVPCGVGYCRKCIKRHKEGDFFCAYHQKRPAKPSKFFARQQCWECGECPSDTEHTSLRHCFWCGKAKCCVCGLFGARNIRNSSYKYICPGCQEDPESIAREMETRLSDLLRKALCKNSTDVHSFSMNQVKGSRIDFDALEELVNAGYDVLQAGLHGVAEPYLKVVLAIDVHSAPHIGSHNSCKKVVTHPSQHLRMFSGSQESRRVHKILSMAMASDLVARNRSDSSDGGQSACWPPFREMPWQTHLDGRPNLIVWSHDCSMPSPTVSLVTDLLTKLCFSDKFSSVALWGRKMSKSQSYRTDDGAVSKLLSCFERQGRLKLFEPDATDTDISSDLQVANADIILDLTGYSSGGIPGPCADNDTACLFLFIGYPAPGYGIYHYMFTDESLLNPECMQSSERERAIFTDGMYPSVGDHNGHHDTRKDWEDKLVVPEDHRPLLVFLGDGSKLREAGFHIWLEIMVGTGDGPNSAILMLLHASEMVMQQVELWRKKFNHRREGSDVIMPGRIRWFSYRSKQELWGWCGKIRGRAISISCPYAPVDVHTLCNDALWAALCHMALRAPGQDWATLVAPSLVDGAGLGGEFIANSVDNYKEKLIRLSHVSSWPFIQSASDHLVRCRVEKKGHFNLEQPVFNMERGLIHGWLEFRRANGVRGKYSDVYLTKLYDTRETWVFSPHPEAADSISESGADQAMRVCNQLAKTHAKGLALYSHALQRAMHLHHGLGFQQTFVVGVGSTTICMHASKGSRKYAIKITHFLNGKAQHHDCLATDANVRALFCYRMADSTGLLQSPIGKLMIPEIFSNYRHRGLLYPIAVVDGNVGALPAKTQGITGRNATARIKPFITCIVCEFVPGGTLSNHEEFQRLVREYRDEGNISDNLTRFGQAILHSVHSLNKKGIANFDISDNNLAIRKDGDRWIAVWIDTGTSVVFEDRLQAPLNERSVASARKEERYGTLPDRPASALPTPSIPQYVNGVSYVTGETVDATFGDSRARQQLPCRGTDGQRDEEFFASLKADDFSAEGAAKSEKTQKNLTLLDGMRCDSCSVSLIFVQAFHPAPKDKSGREKWKEELSVARDSPQKMFEFLSAGLNDGVSVKQPDVLYAFAEVLYDLLRKNWQERISVQAALLRPVFTSDTLSFEENQIMNGEGFVFPEGDCPDGSPWHEKGMRLPRLVVVKEPGLGAVVRADADVGEDQLVCLYAGTEASHLTQITVEDLPPSRSVTYAITSDNIKLHAVADQPFWMLRQNNTAGPLVNAVLTEQDANVYLKREEYWRDRRGHIYMALYAKKGMVKGTFLRRKHDH